MGVSKNKQRLKISVWNTPKINKSSFSEKGLLVTQIGLILRKHGVKNNLNEYYTFMNRN